MKTSVKLLVGGISSLGIVAGSYASASAATPATVPTGWFTGSIASDGATGAALIALATVTPAQASADAVAAVPGTAGTPEVIHDHGYVVYRTIVTAADGTTTEVIVDGGDGTVLDQYAPLWDGVVSTAAAAVPAGSVAAATVPTGWFTGSIASNGATGAALVALATVTPDAANTAAVAAVAGTAGTPEVIHDHGYVVYRTIVTAADGTTTEVIVDAGTGAVLDHYTPLWDGVTP